MEAIPFCQEKGGFHNIYKSLLRKKGIQVVSINEQIDDTPAGKMLEGILEVVDEFYSNNLSSDTVRGMKENTSRGYYNGGIVPLGYKSKKITVGSNTKSRFEIDPVASKVIKRIFDIYLKGKGAKDIAMKLNSQLAWDLFLSKSHLYGILLKGYGLIIQLLLLNILCL